MGRHEKPKPRDDLKKAAEIVTILAGIVQIIKTIIEIVRG